jgi:hypothetical protein
MLLFNDVHTKQGIDFPMYVHFGPPMLTPLCKLLLYVSNNVSPAFTSFAMSIPSFQLIGRSAILFSDFVMMAHKNSFPAS